jgi:hypothetical protein
MLVLSDDAFGMQDCMPQYSHVAHDVRTDCVDLGMLGFSQSRPNFFFPEGKEKNNYCSGMTLLVRTAGRVCVKICLGSYDTIKNDVWLCGVLVTGAYHDTLPILFVLTYWT